MMHPFTEPRRTHLSPLILSLAISLTACGGGGSSTVELTGTAAVGAPLVGSTVNARCTAGAAVTPATTSATGRWTLNLGSAAMLPCAIRVTGGTVANVANTQVLHSYAPAAGVVNVTPLTDLIVATAAAVPPATWFDALDATHPPALDSTLAAAKSKVTQALGTALYTVPSTVGFDLLNTSFNAAMGDAYDSLLDAFAMGLAASSKTYPELLASVLAGGSGASITLPPAPSPAPATPTVSVASANLVISSATPATVNGTLNKTDVGVQYESTVGNATGNYSSSSPNEYCRVAAYDFPNSGDGIKYTLEVVFAKSTKVASYAILSRSTGTPAFGARSIEPSLVGITVDVANRRLVFSGVVLGGANSTNSATLNGSLEYPTNGSAPDRPNCG